MLLTTLPAYVLMILMLIVIGVIAGTPAVILPILIVNLGVSR